MGILIVFHDFSYLKHVALVNKRTNISVTFNLLNCIFHQDPEDLGWQPAVKSWLNKLRVIKIPESQRNFLWNLFEMSVDSGLHFLHTHAESRFTEVPDLSVVQMLCNLLDAFLHHIHKEGGLVPEKMDGHKQDHVEGAEGEGATEKTLLDFSTLMFNYSSMGEKGGGGRKKAKKRLFVQQHEDNIEPFLFKLFIFSFTWAFGGHFNCLDEEAEEIDKFCHIPSFDGLENVTIRHKFDHFARELFERAGEMVLPPGAHLLFSYYLDFEKGGFMLWDHLVLNATLNREQESPQLPNNNNTKNQNSLIPTPTTLCYSFLVSLLSLHGVPLLLTGNAGYGKTTIIRDTIQRLSQPGGANPASNPVLGAVLHSQSLRKNNEANFLFQDMFTKTSDFEEKVLFSSLTFSPMTSSSRPKEALLAKLGKRGRDAYGTRHGEKVCLSSIYPEIRE